MNHRLVLGTMTFGSQLDEAESLRLIDAALDYGISFLDTANVYNMGRSEEIVAKALHGRRSRIRLATKVRGKMGDAPDDIGLSAAAINKQIDASLRRLATDYVDVYYLHMPDPATPIEETLEAMARLVDAGKVRQLACSNYAAWQVTEMQTLCRHPMKISQPMYNLLARGIEPEYLPMCARYGVETYIYNPLAGGLLTGKQAAAAPLPGTRFDGNQMYLDRYWHPAQFAAVDELKQIAAAAGRSMISLSLSWLLHHTPITGIILGASRQSQLDANVAAANEGPLSADTLAAIDRVWAQLRGITPQYNR